jgi:hypothetical protein
MNPDRKTMYWSAQKYHRQFPKLRERISTVKELIKKEVDPSRKDRLTKLGIKYANQYLEMCGFQVSDEMNLNGMSEKICVCGERMHLDRCNDRVVDHCYTCNQYGKIN